MRDKSYYNIDDYFSEDDKNELHLLNIQRVADIINIASDIFSYISTLESIELVYSKYDNAEKTANPDIPAVQSAVFATLGRFLYTQIGFIRYDHLYNKKVNGQYNYSLKPNIDINISNIFRLVGTFYSIIAAFEIYYRDLGQPILGI